MSEETKNTPVSESSEEIAKPKKATKKTSVKDAAEDLHEAVKDAVEEKADAASEKVKKATKTVKSAAKKVKEQVADAIDDAKDAVADAIEEASDQKEEAQAKLKKSAATAKKSVKKAKEILSDAIDNVSDALSDVKEDIQDAVADVKEAISDGIDDLKDAVSDAREEAQEEAQEEAEAFQMTEEELNELASKSLKEIVHKFETLIESGDHQMMYKYADAIKAAFYKALKREKIAIGFLAPTDNSAEDVSAEEVVSTNPFAEIERGFKDLYTKYKSLRASYLQELEHKKDDNLVVKLAIIDELKNLLETQEDINRTFPAFRSLQNRWRESGPIPQAKVKDVYDTYQHYVEMFYDYVKINNELRDLDFKKNLEAKIELCEKAERLVEEENVVNAFAQLQKLHEEWKEFGPVEKEHREEIWDRFKQATSQINKKHQAHFEKLKGDQKENLVAKAAICEKAEAVAEREIGDSNGWNQASKEIDALQKEWKTIGFASKKDNQKIYDRFREACDKFYGRKRDYYSQFKDQMTQNLEKKMALIQQAEALKDSTEWKKTSDQLINLQKAWKEIGPVSRKKSDQIWNRFRAACDYFFDNKEKNYGGIDPQYVENLEKKEAIIAEVKAYQPSGDRDTDYQAMRGFFSKWNEIGFVPFKVKDEIQTKFKEAIDLHFADFRTSDKGARPARRQGRDNRQSRGESPARSERDKLIQKFRKKESEIATYENNIGFFASSKNADNLVKELNKKIEQAKAELKELEETIKTFDYE